ncbi:hypothetical protein O6H91_16G002300 [Diphasiastrum complanatum]|uniref:Uncharacterized protein n=1 Tax=Diphasiastrum complanatum TaxID=34168 RepID=A0ACC2B992_DIPCM|nr:hypothetical protein O6H91_16G002300 [Diphasiastrum complanatum]
MDHAAATHLCYCNYARALNFSHYFSSSSASSSKAPPHYRSSSNNIIKNHPKLWCRSTSLAQLLSTTPKMAGKSVRSVSFDTKRDNTKEQAASSSTIAPLSDVYEFICEGPLLAKIGASRESVAENIDEWLSLGLKLSRILGFNELCLSESQKLRIYHYYVPVYFWCKKQLADYHSQFMEGDSVPALVIGISAPQGCGKTTLVDALEYLLNSTGSQAAAVSIDDFYLTAADQAKLAAENAGNALLELRGNAGTHDLPFGTEALKSLRGLTSKGSKLKIPHYEKSAFNGRGDRADSSTWTEIEGPLEVLLFEGWMLGFEPLEASIVTSINPQLEIVNKNMALYPEAWYKYVDSWIIVQVGDPNWVYQWRLEAEIEMRARGKPGMSNEQVADFVSRYMPAYKAYLPKLYSKGPSTAKSEHTLKFDINQQRNPVG